MTYYWQITLWDKEEIPVRPDNVGLIKDKLERGEGHIITANRTIAVKDIKSFEETTTPYGAKAIASGSIVDGAAQAFNEPIINSSGDVARRAVKKYVQRRRWDSHYSNIPAYKILSEDEGRVLMGFWIPVDQINLHVVDPCTPSEVARL